MTKLCNDCQETLDVGYFSKSGRGKPEQLQYYESVCKLCKRAREQKHEAELKITAIMAYGGPKCADCHLEQSGKSWCIDHIDGLGSEHRKFLFGHNSGGRKFWKWLKDNLWPEGYQVLCWTCNCKKNYQTKRS